MSNSVPDAAAVRAALAPTGTLRIGVNLSNFLLTARDAAGNISGVAVDVGRELARRLGVPHNVTGYDTPGLLGDAVQSWDVGFLADEPARAKLITFSPAYVEIEATYLVPAGSKIGSVEAVDRPGVRIAVSNRSAYELYLTRALKHAELTRIDGVDNSFKQFAAGGFDALAGLRPRLIKDEKALPGSRLLPGRFTAVQQAAGTPKDRGDAAAAYVRAFIEEVKASGFVANAITVNKVVGLAVAAGS